MNDGPLKAAVSRPHFSICMPDHKLRRFCFTWNNYPTDAEEQVRKFAAAKRALYVIVGRETGESGTPHLQAYVHLKHQMTFKSFKLQFPLVHVEQARGSALQNKVYCSKEGDFFEIGTCPLESGKATQDTWKKIWQLASSGRWTDLQEDHPRVWVTMSEKLKSMRIRVPFVIQGDLMNEWWVGDTGTGKSRLAWDKFGTICYQKMLNKWWDGYDDQPIVILEEWSPKNEITASALKIWGDRYPFPAQIKGGMLHKIRPLKIIVISNYRIADCFPDYRDAEPIARRFTEFRFPEQLDQVSERADSFLSALVPVSDCDASESPSDGGESDPPVDLIGESELQLDLDACFSPPASTQSWIDHMSQADFDRFIRMPYLPEV